MPTSHLINKSNPSFSFGFDKQAQTPSHPEAVSTVDAQLATSRPSPTSLPVTNHARGVSWQQPNEYKKKPAKKAILEKGVKDAALHLENVEGLVVLHSVIRSVLSLLLSRLTDCFVRFSGSLHRHPVEGKLPRYNWLTVDFVGKFGVCVVHVHESHRVRVRFVFEHMASTKSMRL